MGKVSRWLWWREEEEEEVVVVAVVVIKGSFSPSDPYGHTPTRPHGSTRVIRFRQLARGRHFTHPLTLRPLHPLLAWPRSLVDDEFQIEGPRPLNHQQTTGRSARAGNCRSLFVRLGPSTSSLTPFPRDRHQRVSRGDKLRAIKGAREGRGEEGGKASC